MLYEMVLFNAIDMMPDMIDCPLQLIELLYYLFSNFSE